MNADADSSSPKFTAHDDPTVARRPLSWWAVAAFLCGLAAPIAMLNPVLWIVAGVGLLVSSLAMMRLQRADDAFAGRSLALAGLLLSLIVIAAAPTHHYLRRWRVRQQSIAVGEQWLTFITRGEAYKAYGAQQNPEMRGRLDNTFEARLRSDPERWVPYMRFTQRQPINTLLMLDGQARIRYYGTEELERVGNADRIANVYAVTYPDAEGNRTTFFVRVNLERTDNIGTDGFWRVTAFHGGIEPDI